MPSMDKTRRVPPLILGHEISGKALDGKFKDKNVVVNPLISCDKCEYCENDRRAFMSRKNYDWYEHTN